MRPRSRPPPRALAPLVLLLLLPPVGCDRAPEPEGDPGSAPPELSEAAKLSGSPGSDPRHAEELETRLRDRIDQEGDTIRISVGLLDLESGLRVEIDAHRPYHAASTMKVPVLLELYRQAETGGRSVEAEVPVTNTFRSIHDGSSFTLEDDRDTGLISALDGELPARRIAAGMIQVSSNLGTNILLELLTPDSVQATMRTIGAEGMEVLRGVSDIPAFEAGLSNRTTAHSYLRTLEVIARCEITSTEACREMMEILQGQEFTSEIPAGIPDEAFAQGTRVGNKTGSITGILHDGAIVRPPDRAPYLLVILTEGYHDKDTGSTTMADLSRIVWTSLTPSP